jgi:hypothetical protein
VLEYITFGLPELSRALSFFLSFFLSFSPELSRALSFSSALQSSEIRDSWPPEAMEMHAENAGTQ